jgi:hypothetical protein
MAKSKNIEIMASAGMHKAIVVPVDSGAHVYYYKKSVSGTQQGDNWRFDRVAEMKLPLPAAVEAAGKIMNAYASMPRRR